MDTLQLLIAIFAIILCAILLLAKVKKPTNKLCKPVMETGRDKGKMVLGNYDITC